MFSPLNDPQVEHWFQRLNGPLKRLPAEERAALHQEVRQHLEALVAANEELGSSSPEVLEMALQQFGDPTRIGRRMAWEWRCSHGLFSSEMRAVLYGIGVHAAVAVGLVLLCVLKDLLNYCGVSVPSTSGLLTYGYLVGMPLSAGWMVGRKYPREALMGAFHAPLVALILPTLIGLAAAMSQGVSYQYLVILVSCVVVFSCWLLLTCGAAYLASITKRGWYKPTWEDFKLTWPKRRIVG